ncbi:MAG: GNAT family N-acetyltransferase [Mycetocola sp.]
MTAHPDDLVLTPIGVAGLAALVAGDLAEASRITGYDLPDEYLDANAWLWELRLEQLQETPDDEPWVAWIVARQDDRRVIGRSGFHGAPDADGMVELSYSVLPEFQRRGYATAIVRLLVDYARKQRDVRVLRASISPDNAASLATLAKFPFVHVGDQMDEIDGLELIFELPVG